MFSAATKTGSQPSAAANYIEDVFSTYLYTGNSSTQTITNGIDLAGKGGLVWLKKRGASTGDHCLDDTVRGNLSVLHTNTTGAAQIGNGYNDFGDFTSTGFTMGYTAGNTNVSGSTYASWTFRKQPKFFDVVTYTGTGANTTISHNLGSVPGMIIVKRTDTTSDWQVYHSSLANTEYLVLNTTAAKATGTTRWNSTTPTSSVFSLGTDTTVNASGGTYVAYLFASNAGGFGTTGTDNVISCGSFTTDSSGNATVNLGYEPQYILLKYSSSISDWYVFDTMRGLSLTQQRGLTPNQTYAESGYSGTGLFPTATGFSTLGTSLFDPNVTLIYMAIRRPMKVPTDATTVFKPTVFSGASIGDPITTGFPIDSQWQYMPSSLSANNTSFVDRLRGVSTNSTAYGNRLVSSSTAAEAVGSNITLSFNNTGFQVSSYWSGSNASFYNFARRPGFFDEVCYTGTGSATTQAHNLGVAPDLVFVKRRSSGAVDWYAYARTGNSNRLVGILNATDAFYSLGGFTGFTQEPTSQYLYLSGAGASETNNSGSTYVAYLFSTCVGVSKFGTYTGNGGTQAIACGFTGGARFVLIKRTDSTGDWYVYDTARGMTTLTDPYLLLNSTAAESATLGSVTTTTGGFTVNASILSAINTSGASYIFLAIA